MLGNRGVQGHTQSRNSLLGNLGLTVFGGLRIQSLGAGLG